MYFCKIEYFNEMITLSVFQFMLLLLLLKLVFLLKLIPANYPVLIFY